MSKFYNPSDIEEAVANADGWDELSYRHEYNSHGDPLTLTIDGEEVRVKVVDGKHPHEGGGEDIWMVIEVGQDNFYKKAGWYASHDGAYWDGSLTQVRPVTKIVTVYE